MNAQEWYNKGMKIKNTKERGNYFTRGSGIKWITDNQALLGGE